MGDLKQGFGGKGIAPWLALYAILSAVLFLAAPPRAEATLTLQLSSGSSTVLCADQAACDTDPTVGVVSVTAAVGVFNVNVSTAITYPAVGTPGTPNLHLTTVHVNSVAAGTINILASQINYTQPLPTNFGLIVGGAAQGTVNSLQAYLSLTNNLFATSTLLGGVGPFTGAFANTLYGLIPAGGTPYSLTLATSIAHLGGFQVSSLDANLQLPEPTSLLLLGSGLTAFGLFGIRRAKSRKTDFRQTSSRLM